jgi:acetyltransferase-like isoleucine patch superfamily enzyme
VGRSPYTTFARPITIGDDVVIGAGSLVTTDIPSGALAFGPPCRVQRTL